MLSGINGSHMEQAAPDGNAKQGSGTGHGGQEEGQTGKAIQGVQNVAVSSAPVSTSASKTMPSATNLGSWSYQPVISGPALRPLNGMVRTSSLTKPNVKSGAPTTAPQQIASGAPGGLVPLPAPSLPLTARSLSLQADLLAQVESRPTPETHMLAPTAEAGASETATWSPLATLAEQPIGFAVTPASGVGPGSPGLTTQNMPEIPAVTTADGGNSMTSGPAVSTSTAPTGLLQTTDASVPAPAPAPVPSTGTLPARAPENSRGHASDLHTTNAAPGSAHAPASTPSRNAPAQPPRAVTTPQASATPAITQNSFPALHLAAASSLSRADETGPGRPGFPVAGGGQHHAPGPALSGATTQAGTPAVAFSQNAGTDSSRQDQSVGSPEGTAAADKTSGVTAGTATLSAAANATLHTSLLSLAVTATDGPRNGELVAAPSGSRPTPAQDGGGPGFAGSGSAPLHEAASQISLPGVANARLVQSLSGSAMQVNLRSEDFGRVSVHTTFGRDAIATQISLENSQLGSALGAALNSHAAAIEQKLGQDHGLRASVTVNTHTGGEPSAGNRQGESQPEAQRRFASTPYAKTSTEPVVPARPGTAGSQPAPTPAGNNRLDIRI